MSEDTEGGCRCGGVRYRVSLAGLPKAYACHCRDCQTWSGSAFSVNFLVLESELEVTGAPSLYERHNPESGRTSYQRGWPVCFTRIYNTNSARPGIAVVRAGTLDKSDELEIAAHIWTKRKMGGIDIPEGLPAWPEGAPLPQFAALLAPGSTG